MFPPCGSIPPCGRMSPWWRIIIGAPWRGCCPIRGGIGIWADASWAPNGIAIGIVIDGMPANIGKVVAFGIGWLLVSENTTVDICFGFILPANKWHSYIPGFIYLGYKIYLFRPCPSPYQQTANSACPSPENDFTSISKAYLTAIACWTFSGILSMSITPPWAHLIRT